MILKDLIAILESHPQDAILRNGFAKPHSYRGWYDQLAFEPRPEVSVASILECAKEALGAVYTGYKGGAYKMHERTNCHLANWGGCGEELGQTLLDFMLKDVVAHKLEVEKSERFDEIYNAVSHGALEHEPEAESDMMFLCEMIRDMNPTTPGDPPTTKAGPSLKDYQEALAFARSVILSGERWTPVCDEMIGKLLEV